MLMTSWGLRSSSFVGKVKAHKSVGDFFAGSTLSTARGEYLKDLNCHNDCKTTLPYLNLSTSRYRQYL
jgi:hypothetical protein